MCYFICILKRHITNQGTLKILKIVHVFTISSLTYNEMYWNIFKANLKCLMALTIQIHINTAQV